MSELPLLSVCPMPEADRVTTTTRIGLLLFDEVEVLDACGPFEVVTLSAPPVDLAVVPGGVTGRIEADPAVIGWIRDTAKGAIVASVCTGAFPHASAGLLDGRSATTHWEDRAELRQRFPQVDVVDGVRYLDHGDVATSAGVSAGIDLALHLVGRLAGDDLATATARQMDYPWTREPEGAVR